MTTTTLARLLPVLLAPALLPGCRTLGPGAEEIARGRSVYNEVINRTDDEQVLSLVVRTRYGLSSGLLEVSGVTASLKVSSEITGQFPVGPDRLWLEGLVPLEVGVAHEVNPTISYVPVRGARALNGLLAPLPLDTLLLLARSSEGPDRALSVLLERMNGLPHPAFDRPGGDRFTRATVLLGGMLDAGEADWGRMPGGGEPSLVLLGGAEGRPRVDEFLSLLGQPPAPADGTDVLLPVRLEVGTPAPGGLSVRTRSTLDLVRIAAACVDVPAELGEAGMASPLPPAIERMRGAMRVRSGSSPPADAAVAVPHAGWWYWIDGKDHESKRFFRVLTTLIELRLHESGPPPAGPVLTIPVR